MLIGFAGLGTMGAPMCRRLAEAGFPLLAHDLDAAAVRRAAGHELVAPAATAGDLARADVVVTMLPDGRAVQEAVVGSGLLDQMRPGSLLVDCGSSAPAGTVHLGELTAARGVAMVDAPVSGDFHRAGRGDLTLMVGGDPEAADRAAPVLDALGRVHRVGPLGAGHALKALNNLLSSVNLAAAAEVMLAGAAYGIDPAAMLTVINTSTGRNDATERKFAPHVLTGDFDSGFTLALMAKDIRIATDLMREIGVPAEFGELCRRLWECARGELGGAPDNTEIVRWLEQRAGAELRHHGVAQA